MLADGCSLMNHRPMLQLKQTNQPASKIMNREWLFIIFFLCSNICFYQILNILIFFGENNIFTDSYPFFLDWPFRYPMNLRGQVMEWLFTHSQMLRIIIHISFLGMKLIYKELTTLVLHLPLVSIMAVTRHQIFNLQLPQIVTVLLVALSQWNQAWVAINISTWILQYSTANTDAINLL